MKKAKAVAAHVTMNGVTRSGAGFLKTTPKPFLWRAQSARRCRSEAASPREEKMPPLQCLYWWKQGDRPINEPPQTCKSLFKIKNKILHTPPPAPPLFFLLLLPPLPLFFVRPLPALHSHMCWEQTCEM